MWELAGHTNPAPEKTHGGMAGPRPRLLAL